MIESDDAFNADYVRPDIAEDEDVRAEHARHLAAVAALEAVAADGVAVPMEEQQERDIEEAQGEHVYYDANAINEDEDFDEQVEGARVEEAQRVDQIGFRVPSRPMVHSYLVYVRDDPVIIDDHIRIYTAD